MEKKIAIVSGASSGMGAECVRQLAAAYPGLDRIWVIARRKGRLEQLAKEVPVPLKIFEADLSRKKEYAALRRALEEKQPQVRFLVNAAGFGKIGSFEDLDEDDACGMAQLNVTALTRLTHVVLPYMAAGSRIIQFASSAAFLPQPGFAVYAASKSYVLSLSRALGRELAPRGIRVTAVCPGPVKTEFFDIAEQGGNHIPFYKNLVMADPVAVVRKTLRDAEEGRAVSVYSLRMQAFAVAAKVLPHGLFLPLFRPESRKAEAAPEERRTHLLHAGKHVPEAGADGEPKE
ncbi:MAG: SDR family NAD(P)-dependent oxidoreductase [Lachnospiraceae bacterium]|nr:SDR family NAD(P)-dependent oxidoreductase [Lachnospiraceae bacterium]